MKKAVPVVAGFLAAVATHAQGTIDFRNRGGGIDAPVYLGTGGGTKLDGTTWLAQLYAAAPGQPLTALGAAVPFRTGPGAGYWDPAPDSTRTIPGVPIGSNAHLQVKVWAFALGTTFEAAQSKDLGGWGESAELTVMAGGGLLVPSPLTGLQPFAVLPVIPEPFALGLTIVCSRNNFMVSWEEDPVVILEEADAVEGPWGPSDLLNGIPRLIVDPVKFFRLRNVLGGEVLNVGGYVRRQVQPGFSLISNPFNAPVNLLDALVSFPPLGAQFFKFGAGAFSRYVFDDLERAWLPRGEVTMNAGEGGFLWTEAEGFELCFSGRVPQGLLQNPLPIRFSIRSSVVPKRGTPKALGIPGDPGDQIFRFSQGAYQTYTFDDLEGRWLPDPPVFEVGEAFFYYSVREKVWTQEYSSQ